MATAKKKVLKVTAPLVQVTVGERVIHMFEGDIVPSDATEETVEHLRDLGFVEEQAAPAESDPPADEK